MSRAFGLRPHSEKASPPSLSDTRSFISHCRYISSVRCNSPSPPQLPPRPTTNENLYAHVKFGTGRCHRRVKSIGDIEYISNASASTSVCQEDKVQRLGPYRSLSERGYSSSYSSPQYVSYSGYKNVHSTDYSYHLSHDSNFHQLQEIFYSPQISESRFSGVHRYGSLTEESWASSTLDVTSKNSSQT